MVNLNKGISAPVAFTIIIVLAIVLVGGIFVYQYYYLPKDETVNWKIYSNEEYGFEIKYPDNYKISTDSGSIVGPDIVSDEPPVSISFLVHDNSGDLVLSEWVKSDLVIHDVSIKWQPIIVDNIESLKSPIGGNMDGGVEYDVLIPQKDKIYQILFSTKASNTETELEVFDQILSTFKFID